MDINRKFMLLLLAMVFFVLNHFKAQDLDKLHVEPREDKEVTYNDLRLSEKGRWLLSRVNTGQNSDTILLFDTKVPHKAYVKLIKMNVKQEFIDEKYLFVQGSEHVDLIRLDDLSKKSYFDVMRSDILTEDNSFIILDKKNVLTWYNIKNEIIKKLKNVDSYATDGKNTVVAITKQDSGYSVINLTKSDDKEIYKGTDQLSFVPQFAIGRFSAVIETEISTEKVRGLLIDTKTSTLQIPVKSFMDVDFLKFTEIENGVCYLMESEKREAPEKSFVEIKYSNDSYLRFRKRGVSVNDFWLINTRDNMVDKLPSNEFSDYIAIKNNRYLLALQKAEKYNYRFAQPIFTFFLYDSYTKTSKKLLEGARTAEASPDGRYVVIKNELTADWWLFDTESMFEKNLGNGMRNPMFYLNDSLLFESDNGLKVYDLVRGVFDKTILSGYQTSIFREQSISLFQKLELTIRTTAEKPTRELIIKGWDKDKNMITYYQWNGKFLKRLIPETEKLIRSFKTTLPYSQFAYTVEESYNQRPNIYQYKKGGSTKKCMSCNGKNEIQEAIRQKIVHYKNSLGKELKGILYYPVGFESSKKYPMIVKIYMEQSTASSQYVTDHNTGDAFNPGLLLKEGYFVFLPDIVMDERGSGLAALDCVNAALDALQGIPSIDHQRLGLTGHSFGGFETNFIATHSSRFKAYFSGSGVSHLTEHYYTNNFHFGFNEYSRIETGQYDMRQPFAVDKKRYWENNPIYYTEKINAPILLWAGLKDTNVLPSQTMAFYTALIRNNKDAIAVFYPDQGHILEPGTDAIKDMNIRAMEWWNYFLKDKRKVEWINRQMIKDAF